MDVFLALILCHNVTPVYTAPAPKEEVDQESETYSEAAERERQAEFYQKEF